MLARMLRDFSSARRAFDEYARVDPRLHALWRMCESAAPVAIACDRDVEDGNHDGHDDGDNHDETRAESWCAEDYFLREVKPQLLVLVGWERAEDPPLLRTSEAYEAAYTALFELALRRSCACCADVLRLAG